MPLVSGFAAGKRMRSSVITAMQDGEGRML